MKHHEDHKSVMKQAIEKARETMNLNIGGPFGAAIIDQKGEVIAVASNSVLQDHDPTAHAEMNAIRMAGEKLGTHDLTGCTIITTAFPCPMCLGAIVWANIHHVIYGCRPEDADAIGFRDDVIYQLLRGDMKHQNVLSFDEEFRKDCLCLFKEYKEKQKEIY
jgi:guanine deaminase